MRLTIVNSTFTMYHIIIILENGEENMAGILLARNNSRIIGVVVNDHEKYEGRVLEDGFVMSSLNALSHEVNEKGYFLMIKTTSDISEIPVFASMWNMDGLILMGFWGVRTLSWT